MLHNIPKINGAYEFNFSLGEISFFKVGGVCDILFSPKSEEQLIYFLENKPKNLNITILGNMSNILISDLGIRGCVVRLNNLNDIKFYEGYVEVNSGVLLSKLINKCAKLGISCCERLFCIPGSVGGALFMNAGIPGFEINDVLISIDAVDFHGVRKTFTNADLKMGYRNGNIPKNFLITSAKLKTFPKDKDTIFAEIKGLHEKRLKSQPIGMPTCGSTFKNPDGYKAWQLIKDAGCDKLSVGGARISDVHCNFLINSGGAKASDFLELIEIIKIRVFEKTEIMLQEEIIKIGEWV